MHVRMLDVCTDVCMDIIMNGHSTQHTPVYATLACVRLFPYAATETMKTSGDSVSVCHVVLPLCAQHVTAPHYLRNKYATLSEYQVQLYN